MPGLMVKKFWTICVEGTEEVHELSTTIILTKGSFAATSLKIAGT
jgi:hypothetical protein